MKSLIPISLTSVIILLFTSCTTLTQDLGLIPKEYDSPAYKAKNKNKVKVKVSLDKQIVYVFEGKKPLLITAISSGKEGKTTPLGNFKIRKKIKQKRSGTYGFWKKDDVVISGKRTEPPKGKGWEYVGYPMPYWAEFLPAYGFHGGYVWPTPRSSGCVRLHFNVAPKLYELVKIGTPVNIAKSQPEDQIYASKIKRPTDYADPDPPGNVITSSEIFEKWTSPANRQLFEEDKFNSFDDQIAQKKRMNTPRKPRPLQPLHLARFNNLR